METETSRQNHVIVSRGGRQDSRSSSALGAIGVSNEMRTDFLNLRKTSGVRIQITIVVAW